MLRRVKSTPDPDAFEEYRDTPPISIAAVLLQKYALLLAESSTYTTNLYHDTSLPFVLSDTGVDFFLEEPKRHRLKGHREHMKRKTFVNSKLKWI